MKLKHILDAANKYYPDNYLAHYYDAKGQVVPSHGDMLAEFIVHEIVEALEDKVNTCDRLSSAEDVIADAIDDLRAVLNGLIELHRQQPGHEEYGLDDDEDEEFAYDDEEDEE
jgi:hypothetical protein